MEKYTKISSEYVEEVHSTVTIYRHVKTGAHICCFDNNDNNKVFCIGFRTPPLDSTGLTHILEHSVLCGSKKYPLKDPFLELVKGSMNTFLNAFTFGDKTCYPCASTNEKDFKNIMSVYCDAVFYPNIYQKDEIFRQEGWRYELFKKEDPLIINGVVYNEMKGAFSNPDDLMFHTILSSLFPDTPYHYESGGDPAVIPELTYERFVAFHKKYYSPSNAFIYLYGNCDKAERMEWLDKEYLSKFEKSDFDTAIPYQKPFSKRAECEVLYPIGKEEKLDKKTNLAYSFAMPDARDKEISIIMALLSTVLVSNEGSPMKKAIQETGLADTVDVFFDNNLEQPFVSIIVKGANPEDKDKIVAAIDRVFTEAASGALSHASVLSYINNYEFKVREDKFGYDPKGLDYILASFTSWLYDDKDATSALKEFKYLADLKEKLNHNVFEEAIKKCLIENKHSSLVVLNPSKTCQEEKDKALAEKLASYKKSLSEEQIKKLIADSEELRAYQAEPSTPEQIATLPTLKKEDLTDKPLDYKSELIDGAYKTYFQENNTNGIGYCGLYFDVTDLPSRYIPYMKLLFTLYGKVKTAKKDQTAIADEMASKAGSFSIKADIISYKNGFLRDFAEIGFSALKDNIHDMTDLSQELISSSDLSDEKKLFEIISAIKNSLIASASEVGHIMAINRALSHVSPAYYLKEQYSGLSYMDFICDLWKNFDSRKDELIKMLKETQGYVFSKDRFFAYFTGDKEVYEVFQKEAKDFYGRLTISKKPDGEFVFIPDRKNEGIRAPFNVNYVARGGSYALNGTEYHGQMRVFNNAVSSDYLWMKIRVKGGAYGAFLVPNPDGMMALCSYRDPNIASTEEVYKDLPQFIKGMAYKPEEVLKFTIGALAEFSTVLHVSDQGTQGFLRKVIGRTYEDVCREKEELINCTLEDLKDYQEPMQSFVDNSVLCVIGNAKQIDENKAMFDSVRDLVKE